MIVVKFPLSCYFYLSNSFVQLLYYSAADMDRGWVIRFWPLIWLTLIWNLMVSQGSSQETKGLPPENPVKLKQAAWISYLFIN